MKFYLTNMKIVKIKMTTSYLININWYLLDVLYIVHFMCLRVIQVSLNMLDRTKYVSKKYLENVSEV